VKAAFLSDAVNWRRVVWIAVFFLILYTSGWGWER
jgi:hypothetical protein